MSNAKPHDFYYSAKQASLFENECHKVNGMPFTEAVESGQPPSSHFEDLALVATEVPFSDRSITYNQKLIKQKLIKLLSAQRMF